MIADTRPCPWGRVLHPCELRRPGVIQEPVDYFYSPGFGGDAVAAKDSPLSELIDDFTLTLLP